MIFWRASYFFVFMEDSLAETVAPFLCKSYSMKKISHYRNTRDERLFVDCRADCKLTYSIRTPIRCAAPSVLS